jgi:uncharacterized protein YndB with AHSA1/START domain
MGQAPEETQTPSRGRSMRIIKKEIVIDAPVQLVWKHITDPEKIAGWLMPNDFAPTVGRAFTLDCEVQGKVPCVLKELVPEKKLVYSMLLTPARVETLVTVTLTPVSGGTRLTLAHSGWDDIPPAGQPLADGYEQGWGEKLVALRESCIRATERGRASTPKGS